MKSEERKLKKQLKKEAKEQRKRAKLIKKGKISEFVETKPEEIEATVSLAFKPKTIEPKKDRAEIEKEEIIKQAEPETAAPLIEEVIIKVEEIKEVESPVAEVVEEEVPAEPIVETVKEEIPAEIFVEAVKTDLEPAESIKTPEPILEQKIEPKAEVKKKKPAKKPVQADVSKKE